MQRRTSYTSFLIALLLGWLGVSGCVSLRELALYENAAEPPSGINGFTAVTLFHDQVTTEFWGVEEVVCKQVVLTEEVAYKGKASLHFTWDKNKPGCNWLGMGIGWNNWAAKNLSEIVDTAAIQFYMRTESGSSNFFPLIFGLEDYSKIQSYAVFNPLGVEGGTVSDQWTRVVVPLSAFSFAKTGGDPSNIKQFQIELQGTGDLYIDEISIVPYQSTLNREPINLTVSHTDYPVSLFRDEFKSAWGIGPKFCTNFRLDSSQHKQGIASLRIESNPTQTNCDWDAFGFSWNSWLYADITQIHNTAALSFHLKLKQAGALPTVKVVMQDYENHEGWVELMPQFIQGGSVGTDWTEVKIPLKQFDFTGNKLVPEKIKQLRFHVTGPAIFYLDEIALIEFRGNPEKPWKNSQ